MSFLAKFRVLTKVLAIICVLSLITGIMAWLGISSLHSVSERSDTMARSAARALLATRANNNVVAMNRAEFRSALDPRDENRLAARAVIDEQIKQLEERLAEVSKTVDEKTQALLPAVRSALSAYQSQMKQTLQSVDDAKSAEVTQSAAGLREVAMKSRAAAEALQIAIRAVANRLDQRVMENNKAAEEEYTSASRLLMILAVGSLVFGLGFGFAVGQYGIARPIRAVVELLQQGTIPWRKPWSAGAGEPRNLVSGKGYRGVNVFLLSSKPFASPLVPRTTTVFWKPPLNRACSMSWARLR